MIFWYIFGLREQRLVALVMTVPAVADHVDDDRLLELLPELDGDLGNVRDRFGIIGVDVENRGLDHARHVGTIGR